MKVYGHAGRTLRVDLSSRRTTELSTSDYAGRFLGGRGIAAKMYWDEVPPEAGAFDEGNRLIFALGPLAGVPVLAGSRWGVFGKSAATSPEEFCYCNLGGRWGAELKFAGYDAISFQGKSDQPVYLFIHDDQVELKDALALWGKGARETREILKSELGNAVRVVAIGPAGENMVTAASLLADNDASGSGGLGAVMGSKRLKAIAVKGSRKRLEVAQPDRLRELTRYFRGLGRGNVPMWGMDFRYSGPKARKDPCYGCLGDCLRIAYTAENGKAGKYMCQSRFFYLLWSLGYYGEENDVPFHANKLADDYGLDTVALQDTLDWLDRCYKAGLVTEESIGLPMSKLGSLDFVETLIKMISLREGLGEVLAHGMEAAAEAIGGGVRDLITRIDPYGPRQYVTTALLSAVEPREPMSMLHEVSGVVGRWVSWVNKVEGAHVSSDVARAIAKRFWGGEAAADFSTSEGKALAAKMIQDREYAKECLILCDFLYPVMDSRDSEDHVGDPALESRILSAVTGNEIDEQELWRIGERVFNLQRAILAREGHRGRENDTLPDHWYATPLEGHLPDLQCLVPGKNGEVLSKVGAVVDRQEFGKMKDEYYLLRGWDVATGLQTRQKLEELGLDDITDDLEGRGLIR